MGAFAFLLAALASAEGAPGDCQSAIGALYGGPDLASIPAQVDGATLGGPQALVELRRARGDRLIIVRGGDFTGADFSGSALHNICFVDSKLPRSNWRRAEASGVGFIGADLSGATLAQAQLRRVHFRNSELAGLDARNADLSDGRLDGGWFAGSVENVRFDAANLSGFRFECGITVEDGCPINGEISAVGANLTRAHLLGSRISEYRSALVDRTEIGPAQLEEFSEARLAGPFILRGGDHSLVLAHDEYRLLLPRIRRPGEAPSPSFDCDLAASPVERQICGEYGGQLRSLDLAVDRLYRRAVGLQPGLERSQSAWLREREQCLSDAGADSFCLQLAYERRRAALVAVLGPPSFAPGSITLFIGPVIEVDPAFHADPLYRRLLPVLIGASYSRLLVRAHPDGRIDARGDSIGANAHLCSLSGDRLFYDRSNGWYSGPYRSAGDEPAEWRDRPMPVLLFWDDRAMVYQHGRTFAGQSGDPRFSDYASCGMRASFGELVQVPVPPEEAQRMFDSFESQE